MIKTAIPAIALALLMGLAACAAKTPDGAPPKATLPSSGGYL